MGRQKTIHFYENVMSGIREKLGNFVFAENSRRYCSVLEKPKDKIEETYFYRTLSGEYKQSASSPERVKLVLLNREHHAALCPFHGKWELCTTKNGKLVFGCGKVNTGMLLNFNPIKLPAPKPTLRFNEATGHDEEVPPTEEEIERFQYAYWNDINMSVLDENGISRDLVYIRVVENITLSQVNVEFVFLDRIRAQNRKKVVPAWLFETATRFECTFDIKKNTIYKRCLSGLFSSYFHQYRSTYESRRIQINAAHYDFLYYSAFDGLPKNAADFIADRARSIIRRNWGSSLTLNYPKSGFDAVRAMMEYPFEPCLYDIKRELKSRRSEFPIGRFDMNGYNSACEFLEVKSFPAIRKMYAKNPLVLLSYKNLVSCGFTDKNLIIKALGENVEKLFRRSSYEIYQFCRFAIKERGEKPVLTMLARNVRDAEKIGRPEICSDTAKLIGSWLPFCMETLSEEEIDMLMANPSDRSAEVPPPRVKPQRVELQRDGVVLPESLRRDLLHNGLTKNNHDALMELDYLSNHKLVTFEYTNKELSLEDEIDGYTFRLPMDSKQLCAIGQTLHNCVSSYTESVRRRGCLIVYAIKDGDYRLCIEVRNLSHVWQQRADYNSTPMNADAAVMQKWRSAHKLSFSGNSF